MSKLIKCKYAGDPSDEYCKDCDGLKIIIEGKELDCTKCAGYEPSDETADETEQAPEQVEETPEATKEEIPFEENKPVEQPTEKAEKPINNKKVNNDTPCGKQCETTPEKTVSEPCAINMEGIIVKSIRYSSGASVQKGDNWYKFNAEEEWILPDTFSADDVEEARKRLWDKLNHEVDMQVQDVLNM